MKILIAILCLLSPISTQASVSLSAIPTRVAVVPGGDFGIDVRLSSSAEPVTGVDFRFVPSAENTFTLTARMLEESAFPAVYQPDYFDGQNTGILDNPVLTATAAAGSISLGADIGNVAAPLLPGDYRVAIFSIHVAEDALPGTYSISLASEIGYYQDAGNASYPLNSLGVAHFEIVPDPSPAALLALALAGVLLVRGRRRVA